MARVCSASLAIAVLFLAGSLNVVVGSCEEVSSEEAAVAVSSGSPRVVTAAVGGVAYFCCNVSNGTSDNVLLGRKQGRIYITSLEDYIETRERRFHQMPEFPCDGRIVLIDSVKIEDSGEYVCFEYGKPTNRQVVHLSVIDDSMSGTPRPLSAVLVVLASAAAASTSLYC